MEISPKDQEKFLIAKLEEFGEAVYDALNRQARARGEHIPSEAIKTLSYRIIAQNPGAVLALSTTDSGRLVDMRRLNFTGPAISREANFIRDWAKRKGRQFFRKSVPGYKKGKKTNLTEEEELERIASAIIIAKGSQERRRRRRPRAWRYNKTIYSQIDILIDNLIKGQAEFFSNGIREGLEKISGFTLEI